MHPLLAQVIDPAGDANEELILLLSFGLLVLTVFSITYYRREKLNVTFARLYGLLVVALVAGGLAFAELADDAQTAAFALLGTIAGYLAGARAVANQTVPESTPPQDPPVSAAGDYHLD